jgi:hypothetical protein
MAQNGMRNIRGPGVGLRRLLAAAFIISLCGRYASASPVDKAVTPLRSTLLQKTSSGYLNKGQVRVGVSTDFGISDSVIVGSELPGLAVGALNINGKAKVWESGPRELSLGLDLIKIDRNSLLWGSETQRFKNLDVEVVHPRLILTQTLSRRLLVHSAWGKGFGRQELELSASGKRKYWRKKYPNGDYENRKKDGHPSTSDDSRLVENYSVTHRSLLLESFLGMAQERFELVGEILRSPTETLILTAHVAQIHVEDLTAKRMGFTFAQQWRTETFGFRAGIGVIYQAVDGTDFDDEKINDARFLPTGDFDFFVLF